MLPLLLLSAALAGQFRKASGTLMRPGIYFGTTEVGEAPLLTGIAWGSAAGLSQVGHNGHVLRHTALHDHKLQNWGWYEHNGKDYGKQFIGDAQNNLNMTMVWTKPAAGASVGDDACQPWVLTIDGTKAATKNKDGTSRGQRAISFFVYAATSEGELYFRHSETAGAAETAGSVEAVISGYANGAAPAAAGEEGEATTLPPKGGFALIASATSLSASSSSNATGASAGAIRKPRKLAARIGSGGGIDGATAHIERYLHQDSAGDSSAGEALLSRWQSVGTRMPPDDTWQVEDLIKREIKRSMSDINSATVAAQRAVAQELQESSRPSAEGGAGGADETVMVPEEVKRRAERLAAYAAKPAIPSFNSTAADKGNLLVLQAVVTVPFKLQLTFLQHGCLAGDAGSNPVPEVKAETWTATRDRLQLAESASGLSGKQSQYQDDLCSSLGLCVGKKDTSSTAVVVASRAVANLVGSVTHFYGRQLVSDRPYPLDDHTKNNEDPSRDAKLSEPYHLLTGVPSRSFFPRGFLWDEGFHQLIASQYKPLTITTRVIASWLRTMDEDGWIAREQILGGEARSRVPERFRVQYRDIANPPAMMLPLLALATDTFCRQRQPIPSDNLAAITMGVDASGEVVPAPPSANAVSTVLASPGVRAFCDARMLRPEQAGAKACRYACLTESEAINFGTAPAAAGSNSSQLAAAASADTADEKSMLASLWRRLKSTVGVDSDDDDVSVTASAALESVEEVVAQSRLMESFASGSGVDEGSSREEQQAAVLAFFKAAYPLLKRHYRWYLRTQAGPVKGSYRWRGVTNADHNFASGLDDYPRGEVPTLEDENVDLLSWMAFYAEALADIGVLVGAAETADGSKEVTRFRTQAKRAVERLHAVHWDPQSRVFCDVAARWDRSQQRQKQQNRPPRPVLGRVCHPGYVSILPLLLRQVDPHDLEFGGGRAKLLDILSVIEDEGQLWSPYGLRSLSRSSPYFGTGENYWRGSVWMNLNYMAVSSLKHYARALSPRGSNDDDAGLSARLASTAQRLRDALVGNIVSQYEATGFLWEHYDSLTGRGKGTHPFTGWTALVSLLVADRYPV